MVRGLTLLAAKAGRDFAGGSGNPLVTTDFALGLRGIELNADLLLKLLTSTVYTPQIRIKSQCQALQAFDLQRGSCSRISSNGFSSVLFVSRSRHAFARFQYP
jgi:hypothetical protein